MKREVSVIALVIILSLLCGVNHAEESSIPDPWKSLKGHDSVTLAVLVEGESKMVSLNRETLMKHVQDSLEKNGIPVGREGNVLLFFVSVHVMDSPVYAVYLVEVNVMQPAILHQNKRFALADTWSVSRYGFFLPQKKTVIRDSVNQCVDEFAKDWKKAHSEN